MRPLALCLSCVLALLPLSASARATVTVVNGDQFVLQAAIDAAADGDILVIKPGSAGFFAAVTIDGKSLTLVVDGGEYLLEHLIVRNVPAGGRVVVRGLTVTADPSGGVSYIFGPETGGLEIRDCAGPVWIDACDIEVLPSGSFSTSPGPHGLLVVNSPAVAVSDCSIIGAPGSNEFGSCTPPGYVPSTRGGDGVRARDSRVALLGVTARGGIGGHQGSGSCPQGSKSDGGDGLHLEGTAIVHASGSDFTGGANPGISLAPGSGLVIASAGASESLRDSSATAGAGLPVVPDVIAPPGTLETSATAARGLRVTSPLRLGQHGTLTIDGVAGDIVALFESPAGGWLSLPSKQGVFLLGSPLLGPVLLATNPVGTWNLGFTTPPLLPAGVLGQTVLLQLLVKSGPQLLVEDVASVTLLDPSVP